MAHSFTPSLEWGCVREIVSLVRGGNLSVAQKCEIGQHAAWFGGCALAWYAERAKPDDPDNPDTDGSLLEKLLRLFGGSQSYGGDLESSMSTEQLCDACEQSLPSDDGQYDALPWAQILSVVIPLLIELLKRLDD